MCLIGPPDRYHHCTGSSGHRPVIRSRSAAVCLSPATHAASTTLKEMADDSPCSSPAEPFDGETTRLPKTANPIRFCDHNRTSKPSGRMTLQSALSIPRRFTASIPLGLSLRTRIARLHQCTEIPSTAYAGIATPFNVSVLFVMHTLLYVATGFTAILLPVSARYA